VSELKIAQVNENYDDMMT